MREQPGLHLGEQAVAVGSDHEEEGPSEVLDHVLAHAHAGDDPAADRRDDGDGEAEGRRGHDDQRADQHVGEVGMAVRRDGDRHEEDGHRGEGLGQPQEGLSLAGHGARDDGELTEREQVASPCGSR